MLLKIAMQMDPIDSINLDRDTTFTLSLEAQSRGHKLFYYQPHNLSLKNGEVIAVVQEITLQRKKGDHYRFGKTLEVSMAEMDIVLMRQDPPFDMNYITYTYMLDKIHPKTLVINNPTEVRSCAEKIFVTDFKEFTPPTLISADRDTIRKFYTEQKEIVLKPLYAFGGIDVFKPDNSNIDSLMDELIGKYNSPIIAQKFLKEIAEGDKRILLLNGEFLGALNRVPKEGNIRANMGEGGVAVQTTLSKREQEIIETVGPELKKRGLIIAGLDVIGGYLTEINVTSPTGLEVMNGLYNTHLEKKFWDVVEKMR
ncbi:MAG: gshB [Rickettsiaceae bacterium]|jgi:glutathione synthase|nr:gshB [Rickettsiaceae bacterium]